MFAHANIMVYVILLWNETKWSGAKNPKPCSNNNHCTRQAIYSTNKKASQEWNAFERVAFKLLTCFFMFVAFGR